MKTFRSLKKDDDIFGINANGEIIFDSVLGLDFSEKTRALKVITKKMYVIVQPKDFDKSFLWVGECLFGSNLEAMYKIMTDRLMERMNTRLSFIYEEYGEMFNRLDNDYKKITSKSY